MSGDWIVIERSGGALSLRTRREAESPVRRALRATAEILANSSVCLGAIFLIESLARLGLGTPQGLGGAAGGAAMVAAGVVAIVVPSRLRRAHRIRPFLGPEPGRCLRRRVAA